MNPTYIIAEIGINHNGCLRTARKLIYAAHEAKVDAVKFQKRDLHSIYSQAILNDCNGAEWNFEYLIPQLSQLELSEEDYREIDITCQQLELDLIVTPMDERSVDFISSLKMSAVKIASADMTNLNLIKKASLLELPLFISTGMWSHSDIKCCVDFYKKNDINFSLLLSNSTYPCPYESVQLNFLKELQKLSPRIGYSGHERGIFIPIAAVALGATIIEKHITFDRGQLGPDHKASLLPAEFKQMTNDIRSTESSLRSSKEINVAEALAKEAFAKSATAVHLIKAGDILRPDSITFKAPGKGIFSHEIEGFYGKPLTKEVPVGKYISKEDFKDVTSIKDWINFSFTKNWGVKCRFHDYHDYKIIKPPVIEFHCSQTDLDIAFTEANDYSELIVHAPEIVDRQLVNLCSPDKHLVQKSLDILQKSIDKTLELSKKWPRATPKMVVHLGGMFLDLVEPKAHLSRSSTHRELIETAIHNFQKLTYSPDDIHILPENLPPRPWYLGGQWYQYGFGPAEDMLQFCKALDLKMTYDICHAQLWCNLENTLLTDYTKKVMPYVAHMHISDAAGLSAEGINIFEGEIDFISVFKIANNYNFSWVTEIWSGHLHEGQGTYKAMRDLESDFNKFL